ncbi:hypothetical protein [Actinomadura sp. 6N118]|uniref:hypothetical protein n=1 Tax=Actinomadura sp. 6N118 TaxID=3375151 RepID=UPI0037B03B53
MRTTKPETKQAKAEAHCECCVYVVKAIVPPSALEPAEYPEVLAARLKTQVALDKAQAKHDQAKVAHKAAILAHHKASDAYQKTKDETHPRSFWKIGHPLKADEERTLTLMNRAYEAFEEANQALRKAERIQSAEIEQARREANDAEQARWAAEEARVA